MQIELADERDSAWESLANRYRVYFFDGEPETGDAYSTSVHDVTEAQVDEVVAWAEATAGPDRMYAIALVDDSLVDGRGLRWLVGMDANDPVSHGPGLEIKSKMIDRRVQSRSSS